MWKVLTFPHHAPVTPHTLRYVRSFLENLASHSQERVLSFPFVTSALSQNPFFFFSVVLQAKLGNIISLWLGCKRFVFLKGKVNFTSSEGPGGLAALFSQRLSKGHLRLIFIKKSATQRVPEDFWWWWCCVVVYSSHTPDMLYD